MAGRSLTRVVHVEGKQRAAVGLLIGLFFLLAFGYVTGEPADHAPFVQRFCARAMPLAILFMPVVGAVLAFLNLRAGRRLGLTRLLVFNVAGNAERRDDIPTIEPVLFLKGVDAFAGLPTELPADVAGLLQEVVVPADHTVLRKGEEGTSMFLVVERRVPVHDDGRELDQQGTRSVFGELALLNAEPRSASVDTTEPCILFPLDQEPLFELMTDRPEVLGQILLGVIGTLQARRADVNELCAEIESLRASVPSAS